MVSIVRAEFIVDVLKSVRLMNLAMKMPHYNSGRNISEEEIGQPTPPFFVVFPRDIPVPMMEGSTLFFRPSLILILIDIDAAYVITR